ncbi:MAG: transporter substrate-binding domain-containing protein [Reyranella sp.]|jgi:polar amino acid transport system substrate-binding protein|uniref:transporter substrate-binding domain-containing protein n=1 Tax=Reyranella sp. TaxID=1929291 RepID=UPI0025E8259F|nr:transporter substrate-binding domain-containing protein [Reyranella sp.]MBR2820210.1 transporter substrate-binding domain-containing protein [Reyranella sp.]
MDHLLRRNLAAIAAMAGAGAMLAARSAGAQQSKSTWEQITETKTLRMAAPVAEPSLYKDLTDSGKPGGVKVGGTLWRGWAVNVCEELAEALGVRLEMVETTFGNGVAGLQANQFDLMFVLDGTPKRAAVIDFVPQGVFLYGTAILARSGADIETWKAIDDVKLQIGVPVGTTMETEIMRRAPQARLDRFQTVNEMIAAFQAGRVAAISSSLTSMVLTSARVPNSIVAMPSPPALFPSTAAIRLERDPRWRDFLTTSFAYLANSGFVQNALNDAYAFRGVDITKLQPIVVR